MSKIGSLRSDDLLGFIWIFSQYIRYLQTHVELKLCLLCPPPLPDGHLASLCYKHIFLIAVSDLCWKG